MKNHLGKNKLERQIARAKKWVGLDIVEDSKSTLKVDITTASYNHYLVNGRTSRNGDWVVVTSDNCTCEKPHFFKTYTTIKLHPFFHGESSFVVKASDERTKECFQQISRGADNVQKIKTCLVPLMIKKN